MKKYILMLAVAAATTLVACGNKEAETTDAPVVEEAVEVVEETVDTLDAAVDTTAAAADTTAVAE